ncbi:MAG TPA: hypothetical protein VJ276_22400 [Thermoanaerobaculia bacterium]|nr:hypothetical protein [Thermoanaerobaculia bacterium]
MLKHFTILICFALSAAAQHAAMRPIATSSETVPLPESVEIPQSRSTLAVMHTRALRIVPLIHGKYAVLYDEGDEVHPRNVAAAIMRGSENQPFGITANMVVPRDLRDGKLHGQIVDAAVLEDGKTLAAAAGLPVKGGANGIELFRLAQDDMPLPIRAIRLRGCVGGVAAGPAGTILALTYAPGRGADGKVPLLTVLSREGVVLGELLPIAPADGCSNVDRSRIERVAANRYAIYDDSSASVTFLSIAVNGKTRGRDADWIDAVYDDAPTATATIEDVLDVSSLPADVHPQNPPLVKAFHSVGDTVTLVRSLMDGSPNLVSIYRGALPPRTWRADAPWGCAFFEGDTLVAVTAPPPTIERGIEPRWQRVRFER